jgi:hypothetical protein
MKTFALILTLIVSPAAAQFTQTPNGQTVYIPQHQHIPARPYYSPQGGPPLGTVIEHNGIQTYVPNNLPRPEQSNDDQ